MSCDYESRYRTISGRCNNLANPEWGSAGQTYRRLLANDYQDGKSVPRGGRHPSSLPNARWISQKNHPDSDNPDYRFTHMVMQFGQFLDHDLTLTPKDEETNCCSNGVQGIHLLLMFRFLRFCSFLRFLMFCDFFVKSKTRIHQKTVLMFCGFDVCVS